MSLFECNTSHIDDFNITDRYISGRTACIDAISCS